MTDAGVVHDARMRCVTQRLLLGTVMCLTAWHLSAPRCPPLSRSGSVGIRRPTAERTATFVTFAHSADLYPIDIRTTNCDIKPRPTVTTARQNERCAHSVEHITFRVRTYIQYFNQVSRACLPAHASENTKQTRRVHSHREAHVVVIYDNGRITY